MANYLIQHLVIIGVGSIGASLGLALRRSGAVKKVTGVGRSEANLKIAHRRGAIDAYSTNAATAVKTADVVFLAVPVQTMAQIMQQINASLPATAIVSDAGSTKVQVIKDAEQHLGNIANFVPAHPIAGTEKSGAEAAIFDLYKNRNVILCPSAKTSSQAVNLISRMWQTCLANIEIMAADRHDSLLAMTSHLPHMLAYGLVDCLAQSADSEQIFHYAAGGFRDFTRIASSDPIMWRDICVSNRDALIAAMEYYMRNMQNLYAAIKAEDGQQLEQIFSRAKRARDKFLG